MESSPHDEPIQALGLSRRAYNCLMRGGIHTVAQVLALSDEELLAIRQMGPVTLAEVHAKLETYLAKHPEAAFPLQQTVPSPSETTEEARSDTFHSADQSPLEILGLSTRACKVLHKAGCHTVADVAALGDQGLEWVMGYVRSNILAEIKRRLLAYYTAHPSLVRPIPLSVLNLSIRPYNALMRHGVFTVEKLAGMSEEEIWNVRNIGEKSVAEIREKLGDYLKDHPIPAQPTPSPKADLPPPPPPPPPSPPPPLAKQEMLNQAQERGAPLDAIPVERLALSERDQVVVEQAGIQTVGDLARQPRDRWQEESIRRQLERYLAWLLDQDRETWDKEIAGQGISPLHRMALAATSLAELTTKWLGPLNDRQRQVIRWRYGLDGERLTLEETGRRLGVTRERARQIQNQAFPILEKPTCRAVIRPVRALLKYSLEQAGGLLNEAQVEAALRSALTIGPVNPVGVAHLLFQLDDEVQWIRQTRAWGLRTHPLDQVGGIQQRLVRILEKEHAPLPTEELMARFKAGHPDAGEDAFILACLRVHPEIAVDQGGYCGLRRWERSYIDEIVLALRNIGEPVHYTVIADGANALLTPETRTSAHNIHAILGRRTDLFVRVGHGIFGLKEWGLPDDGNLANAAYRVLNEAGKPLPIEIIADRVLDTWQAKRSSVHVAVNLDERFVNIGHGVYWLRERLAEGEKVKGEADFGDLFGRRLEHWQVELALRDKDADYDTHAEADAIRQVGLDFFG